MTASSKPASVLLPSLGLNLRVEMDESTLSGIRYAVTKALEETCLGLVPAECHVGLQTSRIRQTTLKRSQSRKISRLSFTCEVIFSQRITTSG